MNRHGYRIEIAEIESVLMSMNELADVCVIGRELKNEKTKETDKRLIAFYTLKELKNGDSNSSNTLKILSSTISSSEDPLVSIAPSEVQQRLRTYLPEYMVPSIIILLTFMPMTPNGKIDREALPFPSILPNTGHFQAPRTALEVSFVSIVADLLHIDHAGISLNDNFFQIGGHSIAAGQLVMRIFSVLNIKLPLQKVFDTPSIGALTDYLNMIRSAPSSSDSIRNTLISGSISQSSADEETVYSLRKTPDSVTARSSSPTPRSITAVSTPTSNLIRSRTSLQKRGLPGVTATPLIGNALNSSSQGESLLQYAKRYPSSNVGSNRTSPVLSPLMAPIDGLISRKQSKSSPTPSGMISPSFSHRDSLHKDLHSIFDNESLLQPTFLVDGSVMYPQSYQQYSLFFMNKLDPNSVTYSICYCGQIVSKKNDNINITALSDAVSTLVMLHSSLRSTFCEIDGLPYQIIHPYLLSNSTRLTLNSYSNIHDLTNKLHKLSNTPFSIHDGPIIRFNVFTCSSTNSKSHETEMKSLSLENIVFPEDFSTSSTIIHIIAHHIAVDGWSMEMMVNELQTLYQYHYENTLPVYVTNEDSKEIKKIEEYLSHPLLLPLNEKVNLGEYALHQIEILSNSIESERLFSFWKKMLTPPLPYSMLFTDCPRPPLMNYKGNHFRFRISASLSKSLRRFSSDSSVTSFMTLFTSFFSFLHIYTGQDDIIIGTPLSGRTSEDTQSTIGHFVNTVPVRLSLSSNPTFMQLLKRMKLTMINLFIHQDYPFSLMISKMASQTALRDRSRSPVYQIVFSFNQRYTTPVSTSSIKCSPINIFQDVSPFDLSLIITDTHNPELQLGEDDELLVDFQYNVGLFSSSTISSMASHFILLLNSIVSEPTSHLSSISPLKTSEWKYLIYDINQTDLLLSAKSISTLLLSSSSFANLTAIVCNRDHITYSQLISYALSLASYLHFNYHLSKDDIVAICLPRSTFMVISMLSIWFSGAAFLPIDPSLPSPRIRFMITESKAKAIISRSSVYHKKKEDNAWKIETNVDAPSQEVPVLLLDTNWKSIEVSSSYTPVQNQPQDLAYVIYTSGSTGSPKGVMIQHGSISSIIHWMINEYQISPSDRVSQTFSSSFDPAQLEIWATLLAGASLHIVPDEVKTGSSYSFLGWLTARRITISMLPTPIAELLLLELETTSLIPRLRLLTAGGDKLHRSIGKSITLHPFRFDNHYGPTEATIITTFYTLYNSNVEMNSRSSTLHSSSSPPIGHPVSNTHVYILDRYLNPVPIGVPGELYIGGKNLARGYLHNPELTEAKFIHDPYSPDPEAKMYKTADLVRLIPGTKDIEFLGRTDQQVKIRGFRIELGEIESIIKQHSSVKECCVNPYEPHSQSSTVNTASILFAYIVLRQSVDATKDTMNKILTFVRERLPDYMIPSSIIFMSALPLNSNGKIDRSSLPVPELKRLSVADSNITLSPIQLKVVDIWNQILPRQKTLSINSNFFDLGGHSLSVAQLLARIYHEFAVELTTSVVFSSPTLGAFCSVLESKLSEYHKEEKTLKSGDLMSDIALPKDLSAFPLINPDIARSWYEPKNIFITGSTGFLGSFVLKELLCSTSANIYCLIRHHRSNVALGGSSVSDASTIKVNLRKYKLIDDFSSEYVNLSRIYPIIGDLSKPFFSLSPTEYSALSKKIDVIFHIGAAVNSVLSYYSLKPANVDGTVEIIRFALASRLKQVHYISTLSVFGEHSPPESKDNASLPPKLTEATPLSLSINITEGYCQSKWVADQIVSLAYHYGIPISIFRPGRITGHSKTGIANVDDIMNRIIKGCIQLHVAPQLDWPCDMTPIDYVSSAIVKLGLEIGKSYALRYSPATSKFKDTISLSKESPPIYHLCSPNPIDFESLMKWIISFGYDMQIVPYDEWRKALLNTVNEQAKSSKKEELNALTPILSIFSSDVRNMGNKYTIPSFDTSFTTSILKHYLIECPSISPSLLDTYFSYYINSGYIPIPSTGT